MASMNDLLKQQTGLLAKHGKGLGLDERSSSIIIANMDATTMPMCVGTPFDEDEAASDDFLLIQFVVDRSGSMDVVEDEVRKGFNEIIMPGLLGGAADQVGSIRYNGLNFDDNIEPLFGTAEWQKLEDDFPKLTRQNYFARGGTALNKAVLQGVTSLTNHAVKVKDETGTEPRCVLVCVTDGANNCAPRDSTQVKQVLDSLKPSLFTLVFLGWQTNEPVDFKQIARDMGFRDIDDLARKAGESDDELRRRVRHKLQVFSQALVRASTSKIVKPDPNSGSTGFWEPNP